MLVAFSVRALGQTKLGAEGFRNPTSPSFPNLPGYWQSNTAVVCAFSWTVISWKISTFCSMWFAAPPRMWWWFSRLNCSSEFGVLEKLPPLLPFGEKLTPFCLGMMNFLSINRHPRNPQEWIFQSSVFANKGTQEQDWDHPFSLRRLSPADECTNDGHPKPLDSAAKSDVGEPWYHYRWCALAGFICESFTEPCVDVWCWA